MKKIIKKYFKIFLDAIPYVLLAVFLFVTVFIMFGIQNALLGMVFLFMSKSLLYSSLSKFNYAKYGMLLVAIALFASLATINTYTAVIINFVVLFLITFVYSDEFSPKNHFLLGLELVLLQIMPCAVEQIPMRLLAVVYCYIITTIFVMTIKKTQKAPDINPIVNGAYRWILNRLKKFKTTKSEDINVSEVYTMASKYCVATHSNVINQEGVMNNSEKFNFHMLMHAEQMAQLIYDSSKHKAKFNKQDYTYFEELSKTLEKTKTYEDLKEHLEKFIQKNKLTDPYFNNDWKLVIESLIKTLGYTEISKNTETNIKKAFRFKWETLKRRFSFKHVSFRFALQTASIVALCFLLADILPVIDSYWIPITAYTIISTYPDDTLKDAGIRILGTIAGLALFALLTQFIPGSIRLVIVLLVGFTIMMCTRSTFINMVMGTQMAVAAIYPDLGLTWAMLLRVSFVIIAAIIVVMCGRLIFNNKRQDSFKAKIKELIENNRQLIFELKNILNHRMKGPYTDEALMFSHLVIDELNKLSTGQKIYDKEEVKQLLNYNYRFLMDINRASMVVSKETSDSQLLVFKEELDKLDDLLEGKVDLKTMPQNIYQIKDDADSYMEFQIKKSRFTMGKLLKSLKTKNKKSEDN